MRYPRYLPDRNRNFSSPVQPGSDQVPPGHLGGSSPALGEFPQMHLLISILVSSQGALCPSLDLRLPLSPSTMLSCNSGCLAFPRPPAPSPGQDSLGLCLCPSALWPGHLQGSAYLFPVFQSSLSSAAQHPVFRHHPFMHSS